MGQEKGIVAFAPFRLQPDVAYDIDECGQVVLSPVAVEAFTRLRGQAYVFVTSGRQAPEPPPESVADQREVSVSP